MITKAEIQAIFSLADKRGRAEHGVFVVEGRKAVMEAVTSGWQVKQIYTTEVQPDYGSVPVATVGPAQFERISRLKSPQGILARVGIPEQDKHSIQPDNLTLALDNVQDPGNLGTIIRIADWFGIRDILCSPGTADCFNPKVVQASMGSLFRVRVIYGELSRYFDKAHSQNIPVYGAFLDGMDIYTADYRPSGIILLGNEGSGISEALERYVTGRISIPSFPAAGHGAESLNVAVATAVIVSEMRRRSL